MVRSIQDRLSFELRQFEVSGGSRNLERGVESLAREARRKFLGCHAHFRSRERIHTKYSWKAKPRGPSQKKSRTLSDSVVLRNLSAEIQTEIQKSKLKSRNPL